MKRVAILSLGCPRNLVDSEYLLARLYTKGYIISPLPQAETVILNTCSFIQEATEESLEAIVELEELKKKNNFKRLVVCGCLVERFADELRRHFPGVDAFVGKLNLNKGFNKRYYLTPSHYAYLKISEGCDNNCSFCVISKIKGRFVSKDEEALIEEVKSLDNRNLKELILIGQDITSYGKDLKKPKTLVSLLQKILKSTHNIRWIRLLYLHPKGITKDLISLIKNEPRICKYLDLPLEHINDRILKLMNRGIGKSEIIKLLENLRREIPKLCIRTSFIVGFPSETEEEFEELLKFIEDFPFERLGAFIYSPEEQTPAEKFPQQIPLKIKRRRYNILLEQQQKISSQLNQKFLGKELTVLVDEKDTSRNLFLARSQFDAPEVDGLIYVKGEGICVGEFLKVRITDTYEYDLVAEKLN